VVNPYLISVFAFVVIFGGAFLGAFLRRVLPEHHLAESTKDTVRLGTGLLGTISALVLGLLIASANSSYDSQSTQVRRLTADIILLDQLLEQYGPEAHKVRVLLRGSIKPLADQIWKSDDPGTTNAQPFQSTIAGQFVYANIQALSPQTDAERSLKSQLIQTITDLAQTRLELFARAGSSIPAPFLAVLILWLTIIFASFSIFTPLNPTLVGILCILALSASGAIFLILELSQPFAGVIEIPDAPLRNALAPLQN
jgi:hypothetical protein